MRLGASIACYRWMIDAHRRRDRPEHRNFGWPPAFLQSNVPPAIHESRAEWMLEKSVELGFETFYTQAADVGDRDTVQAFGERMQSAGVILNGGLSANWAASTDEWDREWQDKVVAQVALNALGKVTVAAVTHLMAGIHNHFTTDPPVEQQIDRAIRNFGSVLPVCEEHGVTLAFERATQPRLSSGRKATIALKPLTLPAWWMTRWPCHSSVIHPRA